MTEPIIESTRVIDHPFCSRCGSSIAFLEFTTVVKFPVASQSKRIMHSTDIEVSPIRKQSYGNTSCVGETPLDSNNDVPTVGSCHRGHTWDVTLSTVEIEPLPE